MKERIMNDKLLAVQLKVIAEIYRAKEANDKSILNRRITEIKGKSIE